jgi:hypothetical protein
MLINMEQDCLFGTSTEGVETVCLTLWEVPTDFTFYKSSEI